nr:MAG TPA: hypothetical protein [Bacteriophage sp.]
MSPCPFHIYSTHFCCYFQLYHSLLKIQDFIVAVVDKSFAL